MVPSRKPTIVVLKVTSTLPTSAQSCNCRKTRESRNYSSCSPSCASKSRCSTRSSFMLRWHSMTKISRRSDLSSTVQLNTPTLKTTSLGSPCMQESHPVWSSKASGSTSKLMCNHLLSNVSIRQISARSTPSTFRDLLWFAESSPVRVRCLIHSRTSSSVSSAQKRPKAMKITLQIIKSKASR